VHLSLPPRPESVYAQLYALLDTPGFVDSVGIWLRSRDLSNFNPGRRPPVTAAKLKAIDASKSDFQRMASQVVRHWPSDLISSADLTSIMFEGDMSGAGKRLSTAMKHALQDAGMALLEKPVFDMAGNRQRAWIVRDVDEWMGKLTLLHTAPELEKVKPYVKGTGYQTLLSLL
jgi:hypothetical protein